MKLLRKFRFPSGSLITPLALLLLADYLLGFPGKKEDAETIGSLVKEHTMLPDLHLVILIGILIIGIILIAWPLWEHFNRDLLPSDEAGADYNALSLKKKTPQRSWYKRDLRREIRRKRKRDG